MNKPRFFSPFATAAFVMAGMAAAAVQGAPAANPHDQASAVKQAESAVDERIAQMPPPTAQQTADALAAADELIARSDLVAYRGWLKYLKFRATADRVRLGANSAGAKTAYANLVDWTAKIQADPHLIDRLRGVREWAYESSADGTGQPFKIAIPTDYDPTHPAGLSLYCHGYSGNHLEHSTGMAAHTGRFDVAVLGRARGGMYRMLSERDVLDVLAYIKATWKIDENRVDLSGGSMGGFASMWFGSRYPDLFACARPSCGFALQTPVENMINLPVYSLHSKDDPVVYVIGSRGPLQNLRDAGGTVIVEETDGYKHAVWEWLDGQKRSAEWGEKQVRPEPASVREIDYTAVDGVATGAWWAHVAEWGPQQAPATIRLRLGPANILYGRLTNIARLRLDLAHSPIDRAQPLQLSLDAARPIALPAPLPATIDVVVGATGVSFEAPSAPAIRPHTPGAAALVYDGAPLLIVYGTKGDAATNAALLAAATAASKSPNTSWPIDDFQKAPQDGISHYQNLYGYLPVKADTSVTEDDVAGRHLVLIGTAAQNAVVARLADRLPVTETGGMLKTSDGFAYAANGNAWALVHYNPLAPQRLVLWLASDDKAFYKAGAMLPRQLVYHGYGADFVVMSPEGRVTAARSFDPAWHWSASYAQSAVLPKSAATKPGWAAVQADAMRAATGADIAIALLEYKSDWLYVDSFMAEAGVTRYEDMALLNYPSRIYVVEVKGADLLRARAKLKGEAAGFSTNFATASLQPDATYTVAIDWDSIGSLVNLTEVLAKTVRGAGIREAEAIERLAGQ